MMNPQEIWSRGKIPCWECTGCGARSGAEVAYCPRCFSRDIRMIEVAGEGTVVSLTILTVPEERYSKEVPYGYCIVEGQGFRFSGWVDKDDVPQITIGSKVRSVSHDGVGVKLKPMR